MCTIPSAKSLGGPPNIVGGRSYGGQARQVLRRTRRLRPWAAAKAAAASDAVSRKLTADRSRLGSRRAEVWRVVKHLAARDGESRLQTADSEQGRFNTLRSEAEPRSYFGHGNVYVQVHASLGGVLGSYLQT